MQKSKPIIFIILAVIGLASCQIDSRSINSQYIDPQPPGSSLTYDESVKKVIFTENTATINFENLDHNSIYLVKVNQSNLVVNAVNTGRALTPYQSFENNKSFMPDEKLPYMDLPPIGHPAAREFNANPPPIDREILYKSRSDFIPPVVGNKRNFWVERPDGSRNWVHEQATLMATGNHGNVWVMDNNSVQVTDTRARELAEKFDLIYPPTTNILGYEYGGGPDGDGGRDNDPKIQILVYDILNASGEVAAGGFFWSKDFYPQTQLSNNLRTNLAEIFYINTSTVNNAPDYAYCALIHELQHMINFNMKNVEHGRSSETWYNEMLSMMTEDIIAPLIGVDQTNWYHPISQRIPRFLGRYNRVGFTEWDTSDNVSDSYSTGFTFGAYLLRNFGGAKLLQKIIENDTTGIQSVTEALNEISSGMDFEQALSRFGEAMIFSGSTRPKEVLTFDRTEVSTINDISYTAHEFNIWNTNRNPGSGRGPLIFDLSQRAMRPHSVLVQSSNTWQNRSGTYSITLERPSNPAIEFYLMAR